MNYHPQPSLFYDFNIFVELPLHKKFYELFSNLDLSKIKDTNIFVGRTGYSRHAMFRALIVKNILQLNSIPRLIYFLKNNLFICDLCAFYNYQIPDETQFYRFINELDTSL
ncbi:transposase, partial [bacterium]|nr:transposase [bacterium]